MFHIRFKDVLVVFTVLTTGLLSGVMLSSGVGIPPLWNQLTSMTLAAWIGEHYGPFANVLVPLTEMAFISGLATILIHLSPTEKRRSWLLIASVSLFVSIMTYCLGTIPVQEVLLRGSLPEAVLSSVVHRWAVSHWIQFALTLIAFLSSLRALSITHD